MSLIVGLTDDDMAIVDSQTEWDTMLTRVVSAQAGVPVQIRGQVYYAVDTTAVTPHWRVTRERGGAVTEIAAGQLTESESGLPFYHQPFDFFDLPGQGVMIYRLQVRGRGYYSTQGGGCTSWGYSWSTWTRNAVSCALQSQQSGTDSGYSTSGAASSARSNFLASWNNGATFPSGNCQGQSTQGASAGGVTCYASAPGTQVYVSSEGRWDVLRTGTFLVAAATLPERLRCCF